MGTIDVGPGATDRAGTLGNYGLTVVDLGNPANDTGVLTSVEIWFNANATGVKVGTFSGSGTSYDDRDYATIGNVAEGSKQTFSGLSITVNAGDYLGMYWASGYPERTTSGEAGVYYKSGTDTFGSGANTYTLYSGDAISIYATGATTGWANIGKINGIAAGSIAKIDGVVVASISKVNGTAV